MLKNQDKYTLQERLEITKQQRISEGKFLRSILGRKNTAYPKLIRANQNQRYDDDHGNLLPRSFTH